MGHCGLNERPSVALKPGESAPQASVKHNRSFWRRRIAYYWRRILRVRATPHEVALGCAAGVFAACTPFLGFQMALAVALACLLRVSIPAALIGTFVGNPLSWPAIWSASYIAGLWVLGDDPAYAAEHFTRGANALGATLRAPTPEALNAAVLDMSPIFEPMIVGGLLVGLIAAAFSYYPTRRAVRVFQKRRRFH
jgi:uncharacterized protein (DUF2062 family)